MDEIANILFDGWQGIAEVLVCAPLLYVFVVAAVNVSGKRTTSQMNNFDWIVTVAIGSIIASGIIIKSVSVLEAVLANTLLIGMQWCATKLASKSRKVDDVLKLRPTLLYADGAFLEDNCSDERISRDEVMSAIRNAGYSNVAEVGYVILENNGSFSVIPETRIGRADDRVLPNDLRASGDRQLRDQQKALAEDAP